MIPENFLDNSSIERDEDVNLSGVEVADNLLNDKVKRLETELEEFRNLH